MKLKHTLPHRSIALSLIFTTIVLTACGGGGESSESSSYGHSESAENTVSNSSTSSTASTGTTANTSNASTTTASSSALAGKALYTANCALCHGSNAAQNGNNVLRGANASATILNAISSNKGGMSYLSGTISSQQASDLAAFLASPTI